jgi:hypothetical protein
MDNTPQFGTAEYSGSTAGEVCKLCQQPVGGVYYRANTSLLCGSCADKLQRQIPQDNHAAFVRAIVFGLGGFILGLALYASFTILTGIEIGFVSLAVGWLVGKAMMMGSQGAGGRRYQIAAVLLTYAAVSMASIPIMIHYMRTHPEAVPSHTKQAATPAAKSPQQAQSDPESAPQKQNSADATKAPEGSSPKMSPAKAFGVLALIGLASPFLQLTSGVSGIIGLVILFVGMQFAWKMTRGIRLAIEGPYQASSAAKA